MTNDELAERIETIRSSIDVLNDRINRIDLNGTAQILRDFGYWLKDHPDFMIREAQALNRQADREQALRWISVTLHLKEIRRIVMWIGTAIFAGFLLALGNDMYGWRSLISGLIHHLVGIH